MAAAAPPTSGATMNSHTWLSACPPTMRAGPSRAHRRVRSSITGRTQPRSWRVGGGHLQLDPETCLSKHRRRAGPRLRGRPTTGHGMRLPSLRREQQSGIDRERATGSCQTWAPRPTAPNRWRKPSSPCVSPANHRWPSTGRGVRSTPPGSSIQTTASPWRSSADPLPGVRGLQGSEPSDGGGPHVGMGGALGPGRTRGNSI